MVESGRQIGIWRGEKESHEKSGFACFTLHYSVLLRLQCRSSKRNCVGHSYVYARLGSSGQRQTGHMRWEWLLLGQRLNKFDEIWSRLERDHGEHRSVQRVWAGGQSYRRHRCVSEWALSWRRILLRRWRQKHSSCGIWRWHIGAEKSVSIPLGYRTTGMQRNRSGSWHTNRLYVIMDRRRIQQLPLYVRSRYRRI